MDDSDIEILDQATAEPTRRHHRNSSSGDLFHAFPNLSPNIDLHFHNHSPDSHSSGYFSQFEKYYEEHRKVLRDEEEYRQRRGRNSIDCANNSSTGNLTKNMTRSPSYTEPSNQKQSKHCRNHSAGSISVSALSGHSTNNVNGSSESEGISTVTKNEVPPIWCLECQEALVIVGCGNGRIEVWDIYDSVLKVSYQISDFIH